MRLTQWVSVLAAVMLLGTGPAARAADESGILVFGAASLTNVLQDLGDAYTRQSSTPVHFSFGASSALARQIESGAPADVFFAADVEWMNYLQQHGLIDPPTRHDLVGNRLVLIAAASNPIELHIAPHFALAAALGGGRLAVADPDSVPAGRYARQALEHLGVWDGVATRLIGAENVRAALAYVDRGEAPLGIVYQTDAFIDNDVRVVDVFPEDSHPPIVYPAALTRRARREAEQFLRYVRSPAGDVVFRAYGFVPLRPHERP
jgi:molybdate transport system substrate-binding protein